MKKISMTSEHVIFIQLMFIIHFFVYTSLYCYRIVTALYCCMQCWLTSVYTHPTFQPTYKQNMTLYGQHAHDLMIESHHKLLYIRMLCTRK